MSLCPGVLCLLPSPNYMKLLHMEIKPPFGEFCVLVKEDLGRNPLVTFGYRVWSVFCSGVRDPQLLPVLWEMLVVSWVPAWFVSVSEQRRQAGTEEEKSPVLLKPSCSLTLCWHWNN